MPVSHIIYDDNTGPFTRRPVPYNEQNAVRHWATHYSNYKYLFWLEHNPRATRDEVLRARYEITIASRKMEHWKKHVMWEATEAGRERAKIDALWASATTPARR